jgi:hypothetical protein
MKPKGVIVLVLTACMLLVAPAVQAQTTTPDPETTSSAELRKAIRDRIEETLKDKTPSQPSFFGYLGTVTQVGTATFSLMSVQGEEKTIQVGQNTTLLSEGKSISLKDLIVGNGVAVIGAPQDELVVEARRVLMSTGNYTEDRQVHLGTITEIGRQEMTLQLRGEENSVAWPTNRQTSYEDLNGSSITATSLEVDQAVLVITDVDSNSQRYIKRLRLLAPVAR